MVKRIDAVAASGINERNAEEAESMILASCGLNASPSSEYGFVMSDLHWRPEQYSEWGNMTQSERSLYSSKLMRMRHYLAGRLACDIIDRGDNKLKGLMPSLIGMINDLEAKQNTNTGLLGFLTRYTKRKEAEQIHMSCL